MSLALNGTTGIVSANIQDGTITGSDIASNTIDDANIVASGITPAKLSQPLTQRTSISASGQVIDFTGIPSWVKKITVVFYRLSTTGSSFPLLRLGTSSGFQNSGYDSTMGYQGASGTFASDSTGFVLSNTGVWTGAGNLSGLVFVVNEGANRWVAAYSFGPPFHSSGGGDVTLSGTLTQLRVTTVNGTDNFDAGSVNIIYE